MKTVMVEHWGKKGRQELKEARETRIIKKDYIVALLKDIMISCKALM